METILPTTVLICDGCAEEVDLSTIVDPIQEFLKICNSCTNKPFKEFKIQQKMEEQI